MLDRARTYPLPQAGAVIRRDKDVVACGVVKLEDDAARVFALATMPELRGHGTEPIYDYWYHSVE